MNLYDFLNTNEVNENEIHEVAIGDRILDENGEIFKFKVKILNSKKFSEIKKKATITSFIKGKKVETLDDVLFSWRLVAHWRNWVPRWAFLMVVFPSMWGPLTS